MTNRLANETSPYLLQHAHNPVDWYPWGEEAFARAKAEDLPVFLSIGYSACHWCHVMERESFEDESIAAFLNENFVSIKVDREERPDVDSIYMQALQMMTGHGGWPMSVFLTPDAKPFFAGTYFPPEERHGMPSFRRVLEHIDNLYRSRRADVDEAGAEVTRAIGARVEIAPSTIVREVLNTAAERIGSNYDAVNGGFGGAPKFPPSMSLEFLMQVAKRTGSGPLREIVIGTLVKMARGGMYDQLGGGFHRYSTDEKWLVPHFEKMLYDNALLARLYARGWQWTRYDWLGHIASEILAFVAREMTSPEGGFYSALDADSEGEEGKFYVWTREEIVEALGERDGAVFSAIYDVTAEGNWEGRSVLNVKREPPDVAAEFGLEMTELRDILMKAKTKLFEARAQRVHPARDEKILAGWNGWMLAAFAEAAVAFDREELREVARTNADFLLAKMFDGDRLFRSYKDGRAHIGGLLEDYAGVAWGLIATFEATHERKYLDAAARLADSMIDRFADAEHGGFFDTPSDHEALIARPKDIFDNATPAANSVAFDVLMRLSVMLGRDDYAAIAKRGVESLMAAAAQYPSAFGHFLGVAEWVAAGTATEIAISGDIASEEFRRLRRIAGAVYLPHRVLFAGSGLDDLPLMLGRPQDRVLAYVCENFACSEPTDDPERLMELIG